MAWAQSAHAEPARAPRRSRCCQASAVHSTPSSAERQSLITLYKAKIDGTRLLQRNSQRGRGAQHGRKTRMPSLARRCAVADTAVAAAIAASRQQRLEELLETHVLAAHQVQPRAPEESGAALARLPRLVGEMPLEACTAQPLESSVKLEESCRALTHPHSLRKPAQHSPCHLLQDRRTSRSACASSPPCCEVPLYACIALLVQVFM